jgi:diacylglycerol O-acyltransferase
MSRMLGYVPLGMNQLVTVAIVSYNGQICCGITADYDQVPDVEVLATGIENGPTGAGRPRRAEGWSVRPPSGQRTEDV